MSVELDRLLAIGRFARLSGLTVKAVRHYCDLGLLRPAHVDPVTGYRFYELDQVRDGEAIRRLRELDVPLDEIAGLLGAPQDVVRERLAVHRARLEGRAVETVRVLAELDRLIQGKETLVPEPDPVRIRFELTIDEVSEQRVLQIREIGGDDAAATVIRRAIEEVGEYLQELGVVPSGPPFAQVAPAAEDGTTEYAAGWPVGADLPGRGPIEQATFAASRALVFLHQGRYDKLGQSYRLIAEMMERHGLEPAGDPVEWYLTNPAEVPDENEHETRIVWPIGPEGELKAPEGDVFMKRLEHP